MDTLCTKLNTWNYVQSMTALQSVSSHRLQANWCLWKIAIESAHWIVQCWKHKQSPCKSRATRPLWCLQEVKSFSLCVENTEKETREKKDFERNWKSQIITWPGQHCEHCWGSGRSNRIIFLETLHRQCQLSLSAIWIYSTVQADLQRQNDKW